MAIVEQLGLNSTFFVQFGIFAVFFVLVSNLYFKPFLKLFEARHKRTVEDREAAEKLMAQAEAKFEEYRRRLSEERAASRKDYESVLAAAKKEETEILSSARNEAKKITQDAAESAQAQREKVKQQLEADVENIAQSISKKLLSRE